MIRELGPDDRQAIHDYAARFERENLFVLGGLREPDPFATRRYFGAEEAGSLLGIAQYHALWKSLTLHAATPEISGQLAAHVFEQRVQIDPSLRSRNTRCLPWKP